jgi:Putative transposase DNA-binding domain
MGPNVRTMDSIPRHSNFILCTRVCRLRSRRDVECRSITVIDANDECRDRANSDSTKPPRTPSATTPTSHTSWRRHTADPLPAKPPKRAIIVGDDEECWNFSGPTEKEYGAFNVNGHLIPLPCPACGCGFVDKRNRRSQSKFECGRCGLVGHADHNAAINIGAHGVERWGEVMRPNAAPTLTAS